jgi:hypothetical protein
MPIYPKKQLQKLSLMVEQRPDQRNTITNSPKTTPTIPAGTPKLVPAPFELVADGLELVMLNESSANVGEEVTIGGKHKRGVTRTGHRSRVVPAIRSE